jgi:hypothetical protein
MTAEEADAQARENTTFNAELQKWTDALETKIEGEAAPAPAGVKMSKKLPKVEIHAYDRKTKDFGIVEKVPSQELLRELKVQEAIYTKLIDCL